ncbi:MAG TPA: hypothetical protein VF516_19115 [Kofleriaceae bacterium]
MLEAEVTPARRRPWRIVALLGLVLAGCVLVAFVLARDPEEPVVPILVPAPPPVPAPTPGPAANDPHVDEPIESIAAASDAPVIAVASAHHVWISRDDGNTFAPALQDPGAEVYDVTVEPSGRVLAMWGENKRWRSPGGGGVDTIEFALGAAELDGRERWRPMNEMIAAPLDARAGWVVGSGVPVIGRDSGESWKRVPSSGRWHVWRASIDDLHTARFFGDRPAKDALLRSSDSARCRRARSRAAHRARCRHFGSTAPGIAGPPCAANHPSMACCHWRMPLGSSGP